MKILWLSWKDRNHPLSGGAETVSGEIMKRLVRDGHEVKVITAHYPGSCAHEIHSSIETYRVGNRYTVYAKARSLYRRLLSTWPDVVIDEMNTIAFGSGFYSNAKNVMLCYQLAREVWLYQMAAPLSWVGYVIEPFMLRRLSNAYTTVLTESNSTKKDLEKYNFKNVQTFRVGMALKPVKTLSGPKKSRTILSLGAIRPMKRTLEAVKAFELARDIDATLTMTIAGNNSGTYAKKVMRHVSSSRHTDAITIRGHVSADERVTLMRNAALILVTSIKEGWGLIITESNSQGTPAIAYDVDGLRDSVIDGETGSLVPSGDYRAMGKEIINLVSQTKQYESLRLKAWQWSHEFTFDNSYQDFITII
jgi:glycosyltransferase involved in cell wall biosynthesis